ncbi:MAG: hypothetical protein JSU94_16805 [Phycisphaerales bacterium]|nr:MAG: hypothetical protein JSU94_16805 [Phycisphaerales bacterium]
MPFPLAQGLVQTVYLPTSCCLRVRVTPFYVISLCIIRTCAKAGDSRSIVVVDDRPQKATDVRVDKTQGHAGVQFVNGQFMGTVEVGKDNKGPVKLTSCGFWPVPETKEQIVKHGPSSLISSACHFAGWDSRNEGRPCIRADGGRLVVNGCEFMQAKKQIVLEKSLTAATIAGCLLRGDGAISDSRGADVKTGLNSIH